MQFHKLPENEQKSLKMVLAAELEGEDYQDIPNITSLGNVKKKGQEVILEICDGIYEKKLGEATLVKQGDEYTFKSFKRK